jgi:chromosome condensin MukBEF complex kleisin-like MukF subunit
VAQTRISAIVSDTGNAYSTIEKANKMIKKAREMIIKAEVVLEKSKPLRDADIIYLNGLNDEKMVLREEEAKISQELALEEVHLVELTTNITEEMKQEVAMKAEAERRQRILSLEDKLKLYIEHQV